MIRSTTTTVTVIHDLEPLSPEQAKEMYEQEREGEVSDRTLQAHHYRLVHLIRWCEQEDIDNMNDLTGRKLHEYRLWRKNDGDLNAVSLRSQLETLRVFLKLCETVDAVAADLHDKILFPTLSNEDEQREEILRTEQAEDVLEYLRQFEYASRTHVVIELLWHTGLRLGSLHALDVDDYDRDEGRLEVRHRPDTETSLKNKSEGERLVALGHYVCEVLGDWIDHQRPEGSDDHERRPLLTTSQGDSPSPRSGRQLTGQRDPATTVMDVHAIGTQIPVRERTMDFTVGPHQVLVPIRFDGGVLPTVSQRTSLRRSLATG